MKHFLTLLLILFFLPIHSQTQIGSDIDGEAAGDNSGWSVSISSGGKRVAIGAPYNDGNGSNSGQIRIYEENSGIWTQIGSDIDGEAADDLSGVSVSLSSNGKRVAIGSERNDDNGFLAGHVRIYEESGGVWTQIGSDIDGEGAGERSGVSVSLSSNGKRVAFGAIGDIDLSVPGQVKIYEESAGVWTKVGSNIYGEAIGDYSGMSVSLSSDGKRAAIGATFNDGNGDRSGHVRIYEESAGVWTQIGNDIDGEAAIDFSGKSVSLSSNGKIVAIGAPGNDGNGNLSGHVRIYEESGGIWTQIGSDIDGEAAADGSGHSVSLSSNGKIVAIGSYLNGGNGNRSGHVRIYEESGGVWTQIGSDIDGEAAGDWSGYAASLSSDGKRVAIGAYNNGVNGLELGHVRVFTSTLSTDIEEENTLTNLTLSPNPNAGSFQLELSGKPANQLEVQVSNALGIQIFGRTVDFFSGQVITDIDLGSMPSGTYLLEVRHGEHTTQRKLSIVR